ncbi:uncharacterized protein LOC127730601 [Mytilus californianus]|uniref:uncharacterized protein LOC127730601 n=1 Tax=Mytilus californianus TaxID=6549 RepID=UPI002247F1B2|nr:uncharacterized protein LOC127730601 [Mytilus californianus]
MLFDLYTLKYKMEVDKLDVLKWSAFAATGMFAGGAIYINIVDMPALKKGTDNEAARRFWKESFLRAAKWQGGLGMIATVTGGAVWFLDESRNRHLWCIGSSVMATIFPWTVFIMKPDINRLLNDNVLREQGGDWVRTKIDAWNKQHMYRSLVGLSVFGLWLYAISKS